MLKKILKIVKKIIISVILLYSLNLILQPLNINIPINLINIGLITLLGIPALISLIMILLIIY